MEHPIRSIRKTILENRCLGMGFENYKPKMPKDIYDEGKISKTFLQKNGGKNWKIYRNLSFGNNPYTRLDRNHQLYIGQPCSIISLELNGLFSAQSCTKMTEQVSSELGKKIFGLCRFRNGK